MIASTTYTKTERAQGELQSSHGSLAPAARKLLIVLDGQRGRAELVGMLGSETVDRWLDVLVEQGYARAIERNQAVAPATAPEESLRGEAEISTGLRSPAWMALVVLLILALGGGGWWWMQSSSAPSSTQAAGPTNPGIALASGAAVAALHASPGPAPAPPSASAPRPAESMDMLNPASHASPAPAHAAAAGKPLASAAREALAPGAASPRLSTLPMPAPAAAPSATAAPRAAAALSLPPPAASTASAASAPASAGTSAGGPAATAASGAKGEPAMPAPVSAASQVAAPAVVVLHARNQALPALPTRALRLGIVQGELRVRLTVNAGGSVDKVTVLNADPPQIYDENVRRTLASWTYDPPGQMVEKSVQISFKP